MAVLLEARASTHPGLQHPRNEDSHALLEMPEGARVLLVCDGMGGMGRGDEASALAVEVIREELLAQAGFPADRMRNALRAADERIRDQLCRVGEGQPGSTAVMVYVLDGAAHVAWVGDSRAYLVRAGRVMDRTRDHKLVEELVDAGQLTPDQAKASALAHVVTRALGGRGPEDQTVKPGALGYPWKLMHGDRILVCSDGLCDLVSDEEMGGLVGPGSTDDIVERLVQVALDRGGHDNITVIVATWEGPDWVEEDVATPVMQPTRELGFIDLRLPEEDTLPPEALGGGERETEEIVSSPGPSPRRTGEDRPEAPPVLEPAPLPEPAPEPRAATPGPTSRAPTPPPLDRAGARATPPPADRATPAAPPATVERAAPPPVVERAAPAAVPAEPEREAIAAALLAVVVALAAILWWAAQS